MEDLMGMLIGGEDFQRMEDPLRMLTQHVCSALPEPPVATAAPLSLAGAEWVPDGVDRISALPATLLRNIVSRLPIKDAARTAVLSSRWFGVWRSVPLVLVDAHLLPCADFAAPSSRALAAHRGPLLPCGDLTVRASRALASHPGPFRCVYLTGAPMDAHGAKVERWLRLFAAKGLSELVLFNRAQTMAVSLVLPDALFDCTFLTRLYLGFWRFPVATGFPHLEELGLCAVLMENRDLCSLLEKCPVLQKLLIVGSRWPVHLHINSSTLRCVQLCSAIVPNINIFKAMRLERLLLWEAWGAGSLATMRSTIRIGNTPNLQSLGFLVPGMHELEIGDTVIKVGAEATFGTSVPSLEILAVQLRLGASSEAGMLPTVLRCFPNLHTLYVQAEDDNDSFRGHAGELDRCFWEETAPIECVQWHVKKLVFRGFQGKKSQLKFIRFIARNARALKKLVVFRAAGCLAELTPSSISGNWASPCCDMEVLPSPFNHNGTPWCYAMTFNLSSKDPFDFGKCQSGQCKSST